MQNQLVMNKTININLGGLFFHIDELAYKKLKRYLDAIAHSLSDDPQGKNEIIADIEARISELLSERILDVRQVVNEDDIEEIIAIMGQPEDYTDGETDYDQTQTYTRRKKGAKKFFRDGDDKFLGGVCSGIGHFVGVDAIWIRLAFILLLASGFSPLAYIILWILLPEAKTTSEKLQMEGEAVNIDNIEKKIRTEFDNISSKLKGSASEISDKISGADYDKLRSQTKSGLQDFMDTIGKILVAVFKVFGKFMGVLLIIIAGATLISLLIGGFSVGSISFLDLEGTISYPPFFYDSLLPKWLLTTFIFILIGIPFIVLFVLGLRILSPNIKKFTNTTNLTLLGIWLIALLGIIFSAIEYGTSKAYDGTHAKTHQLTYKKEEPIKIRVTNDKNLYAPYRLNRKENTIQVELNNKQYKYSNNVTINVIKSETENAYVEINKSSEGRRRREANENAKNIEYRFKIDNNTLVFNAYFLNDIKKMGMDEKVEVILLIPENTSVYFEKSSRNFLYDIDNTDDIYDKDMVNHHFKMTKKGLDCTDCDDDDVEQEKEDEKNTEINQETI